MKHALVLLLVAAALVAPAASARQAAVVARVEVDWTKTVRVSRTTPTLQVVVNPLLRRGSPIHERAWRALREIKADYVRFVPWYPYPRLGIAAMEPPSKSGTSWDFSLMDPLVEDFYAASEGRPVVLGFSSIPQWMFATSYTFDFPKDPNQEVWTYVDGTELRDPSMREIAGYYARVAGWYAKGGFVDEAGKRHDSGHAYPIDYWEVFNEPDLEHQMTPEQYTARYDAVVSAVRRVSPRTKFVGISLAFPAKQPRFFEYFLDRRNHRPGVPLDMISYHFYAVPPGDLSPAEHPPIFFEQADKFLDVVRAIDATRERLSPATKTAINEVGSILPDDAHQELPGMTYLTPAYWRLSGAMYAYLFASLAALGIDVVGESQLVGFPGQFPSVSMVDWTTGEPNARYWVLKLLVDNFEPGDRIVATSVPAPAGQLVFAQGFVAKDGTRKLLLVNKRDRPIDVSAPGAAGAKLSAVDTTTKLDGETVHLDGLAVAVVTVRNRARS